MSTIYYTDTAQSYHEKRRRNCYQRNPLQHYAVFLRMLSRRFKAKFDATSIDEFIGENGLYQATLVQHAYCLSLYQSGLAGHEQY